MDIQNINIIEIGLQVVPTIIDVAKHLEYEVFFCLLCFVSWALAQWLRGHLGPQQPPRNNGEKDKKKSNNNNKNNNNNNSSSGNDLNQRQDQDQSIGLISTTINNNNPTTGGANDDISQADDELLSKGGMMDSPSPSPVSPSPSPGDSDETAAFHAAAARQRLSCSARASISSISSHMANESEKKSSFISSSPPAAATTTTATTTTDFKPSAFQGSHLRRAASEVNNLTFGQLFDLRGQQAGRGQQQQLLNNAQANSNAMGSEKEVLLFVSGFVLRMLEIIYKLKFVFSFKVH